jgi:uncharacterized protein YrrD
MEDLGSPSSFLMLETGAPVYSSDGQKVGAVEEVRADEGSDIFDGVVITRGMFAGTQHFVAADSVAEIFDRGLVLSIDSVAVDELPEHG